jgi:hypothetical protein
MIVAEIINEMGRTDRENIDETDGVDMGDINDMDREGMDGTGN